MYISWPVSSTTFFVPKRQLVCGVSHLPSWVLVPWTVALTSAHESELFPNNSFVQDLPFAILSKCRDGSAIEILKLNEDLHIASARMKPLDPTKHHHGYS